MLYVSVHMLFCRSECNDTSITYIMYLRIASVGAAVLLWADAFDHTYHMSVYVCVCRYGYGSLC